MMIKLYSSNIHDTKEQNWSQHLKKTGMDLDQDKCLYLAVNWGKGRKITNQSKNMDINGLSILSISTDEY